MKFLARFSIFFLLFFPLNVFSRNSLDDYLDMAALFKESGEYKKAIDILESVGPFKEEDSLLRYRGKLEFLCGQSRQALGFFDNLKDEEWQDFLYQGLIHEDLGEADSAIDNYLKSLKERQNTIAYLRLGKIYRRRGNYRKAADNFYNLVKFDPSVRLAYYYLGECLYQTADYEKAYNFLVKAINFYPRAEAVQEKFKMVKERLGESFFVARKKEQEARREKIKLAAYASEEDTPLVRVGLSEELTRISFFCGGNFLITDGWGSYSGEADKLYTLIPEAGRIILKDYINHNDYTVFSGPVKIYSSGSGQERFPFYILSLSSSKGDFWHKERDSAYRGSLEVILKDGFLNLVNVLGVEEYLYGVLSAEIPAKVHPQALKAQAVAARTFAFRNLGRHKKEGFDFCPTVHCQVYQGISAETPVTVAAVKDTRGQIITYDDEPIEAFFHANCGGCLSGDVFGEESYLEEKLDSFNQVIPGSAYEEEQWFFRLPPVFCSLCGESKFRWQRVYDREDFSLAFGEKLEEVKSILLNKKGDCFHYQEIEVITGARKSLKGDLPIRNYLDHLRSSAFKLETKFSASGKLSMLIFWGAGFGHGAGMCQDGAVSMAEAGYDWRQIIRHYFPNTRIKKLY